MTASTPLLVTFAVYLLAMVAIGFAAWRSTRTFDDYILARSLVDTTVPEDDLFAGVTSPAERS